jgi:hypothetical protein
MKNKGLRIDIWGIMRFKSGLAAVIQHGWIQALILAARSLAVSIGILFRGRNTSNSLAELNGIEHFQAIFNHDAGMPKVILLLSPTWPVCIAGARRVQKEILDNYPEASLRVYSIWFSMIPTDARAGWAWTNNAITDNRVLHFWDEQKSVGRWFAQQASTNCCGDTENIVWDAFFLYKADAIWNCSSSQPVSWGSTIESEYKKLVSSVIPLLK